jgi:hypothetical protein
VTIARRARPVVALLLLLLACGSNADGGRANAPRARSGPVEFAYGVPGGGVLGSNTTRGRVTALLFVTTFDLPSQVMARRVDEALRSHRPRINAGAVAVEAPNSAPLVEVFRTTLGLGYPVALTGGGPEEGGAFGTIDRVPTLVVLDARGREVHRQAGVIDPEALEHLLTEAGR